MKILAEWLKTLRKDKQLKQSDIAELLGVTVRHYQDIEYGKINLPTSVLVELANFFDISTDYLVGRAESPNEETNRILFIALNAIC